jgi:hypothetical protein
VKLSEYKQDFYTYSGIASDVARMAAFAGIALVWVFKIDAKPVSRLPQELLVPSGFFALAIALDLLQYVAATAIWGLFHRYHERSLVNPTDDPELSHSPWLVCPLHFLFALKLISVMAGYVLVGRYLIGVWFRGNG